MIWRLAGASSKSDVTSASRSHSTTPEYNKTPDVPILQPVPLKNAKGAGAGGAEKTKFVMPPPKPQRVFNSGVADSRMNTTIRDTVMRLYSSSSETSETSELTSTSSAARHVIQQQPTLPTKPASLPLSQQRSSTSQKPLPSPKPKSPKKAPALLYPEQALAPKRGGGGGGGGQRNRIAAVTGSSGKSASFDEGDVHGHGGSATGQGRRLGSSNSDSSSANTVFTSDRGSPSAVSDISVFSAENLMYDAIIMGTDQQRRHDLDKRRGFSISPQREGAHHTNTDLRAGSLKNSPEKTAQQHSSAAAAAAKQRTQSAHAPVAAAAEYCDVPVMEVNSKKPPSPPAPAKLKQTSAAVKPERRRVERVYDEIELNASAPSDAAAAAAGDDDPYAYVGGNDEKAKWSLQHIALGISTHDDDVTGDGGGAGGGDARKSIDTTRKSSASMVGDFVTSVTVVWR